MTFKNLHTYIIATIFAFTIHLQAAAQIQKGTYLIGGSANVSGSTIQTVLGKVQFGSFSYSLLPRVGVFVKDQFALGANITLAQSFSSNNQNSAIAIGPFGRYYFYDTEREVNLFGQAGFALGTNINNNIRQDRFSANLGFGPAFFINRSIALEMTLNYNFVSVAPTSTGRFSLNFGFQIHFNPNETLVPAE